MAIDRNPIHLAPKFRAAVEAAIAECRSKGLEVILYEGLRSNETQKAYFERGVTKAKTAEASWHGYGLAVDVIHEKLLWNASAGWWQKVADIFKSHGLDWGGDWVSFKDLPHFQWGRCRSTPSATSRRLHRQGRYRDVWPLVGAA